MNIRRFNEGLQTDEDVRNILNMLNIIKDDGAILEEISLIYSSISADYYHSNITSDPAFMPEYKKVYRTNIVYQTEMTPDQFISFGNLLKRIENEYEYNITSNAISPNDSYRVEYYLKITIGVYKNQSKSTLLEELATELRKIRPIEDIDVDNKITEDEANELLKFIKKHCSSFEKLSHNPEVYKYHIPIINETNNKKTIFDIVFQKEQHGIYRIYMVGEESRSLIKYMSEN